MDLIFGTYKYIRVWEFWCVGLVEKKWISIFDPSQYNSLSTNRPTFWVAPESTFIVSGKVILPKRAKVNPFGGSVHLFEKLYRPPWMKTKCFTTWREFVEWWKRNLWIRISDGKVDTTDHTRAFLLRWIVQHGGGWLNPNNKQLTIIKRWLRMIRSTTTSFVSHFYVSRCICFMYYVFQNKKKQIKWKMP